MLVIHGICTGETHRDWSKTDRDTGEVRGGTIDRWTIFDGQQAIECQLSDDYGTPPKRGEVVTASVLAVSEYQRRPQLTLGAPVDASVVKVFTPEMAAALVGVAAAAAPARAAS
ncbi:MAG TPA: hypothetical protein DCM67_00590 [Propionibacteriaceae bacterium]|nr:hypothetical protein [Propionibacteriaceae bacterium]